MMPRIAVQISTLFIACFLLLEAWTGRASKPSRHTSENNPGAANVIVVAPGLISGSVPVGDPGFASLRGRGVRTVISVDAAAPDATTARRYGMRYVHLPIQYSRIPRDRQLQLARAIQELPGSVYVHCHHGRHRGPAAAAAAAVILGYLTPSEGVALMRVAGTSVSYQGLYESVRQAQVATPNELARVPADFPEQAVVTGLASAMAEIQVAYDHLVQIQNAGWQVPPDHPDLVASAEAGRIENLLRRLQDDPASAALGALFVEDLKKTRRVTRAFESALEHRERPDRLTKRLQHVTDSCNRCHQVHRD